MPILIIGGLLVIYGIFAIYSVSIYESFEITLKAIQKGSMLEVSNYFYFSRQLLSLFIGLIISSVVYMIPMQFIQNHKNKIFILSFIFQLLVFTFLGVEFNGSKGWLHIAGLGTIQPAEIFKLGFVIYLSGWLVKKKKELPTREGFGHFIILIGLLCLVFLFIPDLGTILVLGSVALLMYWYAGGKWYFIIGLLTIGLFGGLTIGSKFSYVKKRIDYFLNDNIDVSGRGVGWQIEQALIAVGGGGIIGNGYGKGLQKFGYIPEAQSDFIFAAFSEEVGLLGNIVLLGLYFTLQYYFLQKLKDVKDEYLRNLGVGIISLLMMETFINIGVNIKIIPLTGLTLPLISYGGTALLINLTEIVLMYNIININHNIQKNFS